MTSHHKFYAALASFMGVALVLPAAEAYAQSSPLGVWLDHTGRGAVEITPCGGALCGRVVWVKSVDDAKGCGRQIIGDAKPIGKSGAHNGWIYSPERRRRYDVEFKTTPDGRLKVVGYAGTKLFSRTMMWKRPANELPRCDVSQATVHSAKTDAASSAGKAPAQKEPMSRGGIGTAAKTAKPAAPAPATTARPEPEPVSSEAPALQRAQPAPEEAGDTSAAANAAEQDDGADDNAGNHADDNGRGGEEPGARMSEILDKVVTRGANGDCKLDLPWVKVRFRCDRDD